MPVLVEEEKISPKCGAKMPTSAKFCGECGARLLTEIECSKCGASLAEPPDDFTDPRDGKTYKTVKIGNKIWMAENLAYDGVENDCPDDDRGNVKKYGYLYTWENAKKACPTGWRLPTSEEFLALIGANSTFDMIKNTAIQDTSWVLGATNSTGFSALPAGFLSDHGEFFVIGSNAVFWSSTPIDSDIAYGLCVYSSGAYVSIGYVNNAFSVRCLKDSN